MRPRPLHLEQDGELLLTLVLARSQVGRLARQAARARCERVHPHALPRRASRRPPLRALTSASASPSLSLSCRSCADPRPDAALVRPQRIDRTTSALHSDLSSLLSAILAGSPSAPSYRDELTTALRTFASLGLVAQAEDLIRNEVVRPFARRVIHRDALSASSSTSASAAGAAPASHAAHVPAPYRLEPLPVPAPADAASSSSSASSTSGAPQLAALYNRVLDFVATECGVVLDVAERVLADVAEPGSTGSGPAAAGASEGREDDEREGDERVHGFEVLANVVVDEVATALMGELGSVVFAAGRPAVFHQVRLEILSFAPAPRAPVRDADAALIIASHRIISSRRRSSRASSRSRRPSLASPRSARIPRSSLSSSASSSPSTSSCASRTPSRTSSARSTSAARAAAGPAGGS